MEQLHGRDAESRSEEVSSSGSRPHDMQTQASPDREIGMDREDEIRRRAYELYEERGGRAGNATDDWLAAEREIQARDSGSAEQGMAASSRPPVDASSRQAGDSASGIPTSREPSAESRRTGRSRQSPSRANRPPS